MSDTPDSSGLILSADVPGIAPSPLRDGDDVSWLPRCRVGDDQGQTGACSIFAIASWAEIMFDYDISDAEALDVYRAALKRYNRPAGSGLQFREAFPMCATAGWLPGKMAMFAVRDLAHLSDQPIIAAGAITDAWHNASIQSGCLDHDPALTKVHGYHAYVIVGHGAVTNLPDRWVTVENSWGFRWGWNGLGVMSESLHTRLCRELWILE